MTVDSSAYGGSNGSGGRTYDSVDQILERQVSEHAAVEKAASDPHSLTYEEALRLPAEMLSDLMRRGQLGHLGFGGKDKSRRQKRARDMRWS